MMSLSESRRDEIGFELTTVFKPTTPINREDLFAGRKHQIDEVVGVINQQGQHAVLYGERGVGKTSLANMIFPKLHCAIMPIIAPHINCMGTDEFHDIWKRVCNEILIQMNGKPELELPENACRLMKDVVEGVREIDVDVVRSLLHELGQNFAVVCIIDEFDTVVDFTARGAIADMIKFLSDRNVPATIVLIGVAEDVESLIENHRSVERCLHQVYMPRMSRDEIEDIVRKGLVKCDMDIADGALHEISRISRGLPHYTHLLGLHSGRAALNAESLYVTEKHVKEAAGNSLIHAQHSVKADYNLAVSTARDDSFYREALLACAMSQTDDLGFFYPKDIKKPLGRIRKKTIKDYSFQRYIRAFCSEVRGAVLEAI